MSFVHTRDARFHVIDLTPAKPAAPRRALRREPVVMLHELFTGSAASWFFTIAPAVARTRRVRLPDWRGHGMSERTATGYGAAAMAADLAELTADLPPFAIAGHGHGASVAVRLALAHPGRVTRLALIDPPFPSPRAVRPPASAKVPAWATAVPGAALIAEASPPRAARVVATAGARAAGESRCAGGAPLAEAARDGAGPGVAALVRQASRRPDSGGRRRLAGLLHETRVLDELAADPPVTAEELAALGTLPVLAVVGTDSPFRPAAEPVERALPRSRRHVLAGGHDLHITARARLTRLLTTFLEEDTCPK
ncbi:MULTISPECIES: alpha/beta hydrolase [Actinomadura]|uniref:Alpha/beta hydrolase n=1 Tax=Actinomadura yumaensis TaxID=111807 RepID=A0ABW2CVL8_9ACTN|nr:alpha/beta hydrolase [Actinomadura sp. J1-007]MWK37629.1 alpha/beta fold hydrolase [Actinomadura sp. J1-007]